MASSGSKIHSDRCINPYNLDSHVGKNLRSLSKNMLKFFSQYSGKEKICDSCRKYANKHSDTTSRFGELDSSVISESEESDGNIDPSPNKKIHLSREQELEEMLDGLKTRFSSLPPNDPLRMMILTIAPNCWSIKKTAKEFGTSRKSVRKAKKLKESEGILATPVAKAGKILSQDTVDQVLNFYENDENSRIMPNKKDVFIVKENGEKVEKQKRLLLCDVKSLHVQFKELYPQFRIGLSKFAELRPKWCVLAGASGTHTVCVCTIHQNFKTMFDAVNLVKITKGSKTPMKNYQDCFQFILCKNPSSACYLRECQSCPKMEEFSEYITNILEDKAISQVIFSIWQATDRCTLKKECLSSEDFVVEFSTRLETLLPHHFLSKNQSRYIKNLKENLKSDEVLVHTDFSENFAFVVQEAAQGFHYNNNQCTVHPVIFYYRADMEVIHKSLILLSDCTTHDASAVYLMQKLVVPEIKKTCPKVRKIIYISDGAKQHYKNKYQMSNLAHHKEDFDIVADWHFHATAHGKGACDGVGAILKREATRASLQAKPNDAILTSKSLFEWAKKKFKTIQFFYYNEKEHKKIKKSLEKRFSVAPKVPKISSGHAFLIIPEKKLKVMKFSSSTEPMSIVQY